MNKNLKYGLIIFGVLCLMIGTILLLLHFTKKCPKGTYKGFLSCKTCKAGSYCPGGGASNTKCSAGTYSDQGSLSCKKCEAGYYCPGGSNHIACAVGTSSQKEASSCKECAAGTYNNKSGSICNECEANYYCQGGTNHTKMRCRQNEFTRDKIKK